MSCVKCGGNEVYGPRNKRKTIGKVSLVSCKPPSLVGLFFVFCLIFFSSYALAHDELVEGCLFCLHFWCSRWPFRAVVLVNSAPQSGQLALVAWPDFSR